jgi:hypothetical protein
MVYPKCLLSSIEFAYGGGNGCYFPIVTFHDEVEDILEARLFTQLWRMVIDNKNIATISIIQLMKSKR